MFMLAGLCPSVVFVNLYCLCSEMLEKIGPHSASSLPTVSSTDGGFSAVPALDLLDILQARIFFEQQIFTWRFSSAKLGNTIKQLKITSCCCTTINSFHVKSRSGSEKVLNR